MAPGASRLCEDRLPAPLLAGRFADGTTLGVLNPAPHGDTTAADGNSVQGGVMTDERFRIGAIGAEEQGRRLGLGYWFPGSEGEVTYAGNTYPGGQLHQWRRRFHPLRDGFEQRYAVAFRFGHAGGLAACCRETWRWAWQTLQPQVNAQDIPTARARIVDALAANVVEASDRAGIPNAVSAVPGPEHRDAKTVMGFTGKALESAEFLLAEARLDNTARSVELRRKAERIIASFLRLKMAPPEGEGFVIATGQPTTALSHAPGHPEAYLLLFETTGERKWLDRARVAADLAETWIYLWNVPLPADADDGRLHWKQGVPTTGLQLIATGHSLVDAYMAFDADEFARLYRHTGDEHYRDVARILLHNTKAMVALPAHPYDLRGLGWQQEHYSFAPPRGLGLHRLWLPWVATSQLNGIFGLMEFDPPLFENLAGHPLLGHPQVRGRE